MSKENIGKIYSRKRFLLKTQLNSAKGEKNDGVKNSASTNNNARTKKSANIDQRENQPNINSLGFKSNDAKKKLRKKIIKLIIIAILIMLIIQLVFYYFEPIFEAMCEEKVKSLATIITNQQSTLVMKKYQYEELYTIEKDSNGNIVIIKSNVVPINNLISELTENIQNEFDKIENPTIDIPLGNLSGIYLLSGSGPEITIEVSITGTVDTEIKSEFIAQGINQTLHRVYVNFECNMKIVTPLKNYNKKVTNQVIIAEHVIVGNIPNSYYNLEGIESDMDTLNVLE